MEASLSPMGSRVLAVKGSTYMMRSQRRRHYEPPAPEPEPSGKPPKEKKPKPKRVKRARRFHI